MSLPNSQKKLLFIKASVFNSVMTSQQQIKPRHRNRSRFVFFTIFAPKGHQS